MNWPAFVNPGREKLEILDNKGLNVSNLLDYLPPYSIVQPTGEEMKRHERHDTVPGKEKYDEYKLMPQLWGWILLLALSASLILWAHWIHSARPSVEWQWDYSSLPQTPAESIYSSESTHPEAELEQQLPVPSESKPLEPSERQGR